MTIRDVDEKRTEVPAWYSSPCMMGIDEAGRGPVLGPMVYGCAFTAISEADNLKTKEFADSKTLSREKRDKMFDQLQKDSFVDCLVDSISAISISNSMLGRQKTSLNAIAADSTCKLIRTALNHGVDLQEIYVDTVGDAKHYQDKLSREFPGIKFTVCPKADSLFPIVSAASIAAKVYRDRSLEGHVDIEGLHTTEFGSGYPADPETKTWLEKHTNPVFGFPSLVRFAWSTSTSLMETHCVPVKWECEEDGSDQPSLHAVIAGTVTKSNRHSYFKARRLQRLHAAW